MRTTAIAYAVMYLALAAPAGAERQAELKVTADVGLTSVRGKMRYSNGAGPATPIMQNQNWSGFENKTLLMAFDASAIKGWTVSRAFMELVLARGNLWGVGLCTVLADWDEGKALNMVEAVGAPCWDFRRTPPPGTKPSAEHWWAWPASRFFSVCWSHPAARYSHAGPGEIQRTKTKDGRFVRLRFAVDPKLVESLAAGVGSGLVLTDDKGQVRESYSLIGPAYPYRYDPAFEAWVFTKDIHKPEYRPRLIVFGDAVDHTPPAAPKDLKVAEVHPADGSFTLEFIAPGDDGMTGEVLAYEAAWSDRPITPADWAGATALPRWSLPRTVPAGRRQRMPVFALPPGRYYLAVRGVDEAGNRGPVASLRVVLPPPPPAGLAPAGRSPAGASREWVAEPGKLAVLACGDTVKVDPVSGFMLRDGSGYRKAELARPNPVWNAARRTVSLTAAANEVVAFQVILRRLGRRLTGVRVAMSNLLGPAGGKIPARPNVECYRLWYVSPNPAAEPADPARPSTWQGDACLPLAQPFGEGFDIPAADNKVAGQRLQSVWVDLYVPRGTPPGRYKGTITITAKELSRPVELTVALEVLPLSLPDEYTFVLELNRYHSVVGWAGVDARKDPDQAMRTTWDCYRLAHRHRCVLNVLPYSHSGRVDRDYVPAMAGQGTDVRVKDWSEYDRRFGPLLDGSAFSARAGYVGPGAGVPVHHMYTAFHEAWPVWLDASTYKDHKVVKGRLDFAEYAKQARRPAVAFTEAYKQGFMRVARQFFRHFKAKGWTRTSLHFFNNNKYYWKVAYFGGMGRGGVCFWLMDEPADFDDYDANGFVMSLAHRAYRTAGAPEVRMDGRADVSQPEMARGLWDGIATVWCIGGMRGYWPTAAARRRWLPREKHWCYGGGVRVDGAAVQLWQAGLTRWCCGVTGWMPWWNCFGGGSRAWKKAQNLAIYYTGKNYANSGRTYPRPIAGVRLKLARRIQQDIEYLHLLGRCKGWGRHRVRRALAAYSDDPTAPVLTFNGLTLDRLNELRRRVVATILAAK